MAALYQALENTILTNSALETFGYDDMKAAIAEEIGLTNPGPVKDEDLLYYYHEGTYIL